MTRPRVLAVADGWIPSVELVLREPFRYLQAQGALESSIRLISEPGLRDLLPGHSVLLLMRVYQPEALELAERAGQLGIPVIYAIDDDFEAIDPRTPLGKIYRDSGAWKRIESICAIATQVWTFSPVLRRKLLPVQTRILVLPAIASVELVASCNVASTGSHDGPVIGYAASLTHAPDLASIASALRRVLDERPDARLEVVNVSPAGLADHPRVTHFPALKSIRQYYEFVLGRRWTIGVAPLLRCATNDARTDNKYREYAALGIPGVYSDAPPYWPTVYDEVTGLFATDEESWKTRIDALLSRPALREQIATIARRDIENRCSITAVSQRYRECLESALDKGIDVLVLAPTHIASVDIDIIRPLNVLAAEGLARLTFKPPEDVTDEDIGRAGILVIVRYTDHRTLALVRAARARRVPVVYSYDDDFFAMPEGLGPLTDYYRHPDTIANLEAILRESSLVKASTARVASRSQLYNDNVVQAPYCFDFSQLAEHALPVRTSGGITIGFFGNYTHGRNVELLRPALTEVAMRHSDVRFEFFGPATTALEDLPRTHFLPWQESSEASIRMLASRRWDIGLAPLEINEFNRAKLPTKYRDYAACRVAGIYTDIEPYRDIVRERETGLLVPNVPEEWISAIARLVEDGELRNKIRRNAFFHVRSELGLDRAVRTWRQILLDVRRPDSGNSAGQRSPEVPVQELSLAGRLVEAGRHRSALADVRRVASRARRLFGPGFRWRLVQAIKRIRHADDFLGRLAPCLHPLVDRFKVFGIAGRTHRLRLSRNLQSVPYIEYAFSPFRAKGESVEVAVWASGPLAGGQFGVEIVSSQDSIVAHKLVPIEQLDVTEPVRFAVGPLDIDDPIRWRIRFFARSSPCPIHVYQWEMRRALFHKSSPVPLFAWS